MRIHNFPCSAVAIRAPHKVDMWNTGSVILYCSYTQSLPRIWREKLRCKRLSSKRKPDFFSNFSLKLNKSLTIIRYNKISPSTSELNLGTIICSKSNHNINIMIKIIISQKSKLFSSKIGIFQHHS